MLRTRSGVKALSVAIDRGEFTLNARLASRHSRSLVTVLLIYATIEHLTVASFAYAASSIYYFFVLHSTFDVTQYVVAAVAIASLVLGLSIVLKNFIGVQKQARHIFLWKGIVSVFLAFSVFITVLFFVHFGNYSRGTFVVQIAVVGFVVGSGRVLFYAWLQRAIAKNEIKGRQVVLIGEIADQSSVIGHLEKSGAQIVGSIPLPEVNKITDQKFKNLKIDKTVEKIRSLRPDDIIILAPANVMGTALDLSYFLAELPTSVHIVPADTLGALTSARVGEIGNVHTIQVCQPPLSLIDRWTKRACDIAIALVGLILLAPLFLFVSVVIKLDGSGPIIFRQRRHCFNNEEIFVFKFRSMTKTEDGNQFEQAVNNDPRVTPVGRIIRRTNIDELPQLFNVLTGEMSIVGPRPHPTALNHLFEKSGVRFSRRHNVKPGITGWAQVNGYRGATDSIEKMQQRMDYDLYYIDNWSLLFDLKIILMTVFSMRSYTNAY